PRLINIICDNGLLTAYALNELSVSVPMIDEVARDLNLSSTPRRPAPVTTATIPIKFPEALAALAEPKSPPPPSAAVPPLRRVEENAAVAVHVEPQPPPEIQSAARAALEAAQRRAAEIQQAQARQVEERERSFPKPTLAPKIAPKPAAAAEPAPATDGSKAEEKVIESFAREPESITNGTAAQEPEAKIAEAIAKAEADAVAVAVEEREAKISGTETPAPDADAVPPQSIDRLIAALTDAMGPMASLVVRDHVDAMGESTENFPKRRFHELVYSTSGEILSARLRARYESLMSQEVRALGAFEE
ncbi:MAG TPA: hypothetical protein VKH64_17870, partial [Candidatus Binatia bacterium]|nr:hypothetical protein [Candidatus Binatia bacterium]